MCRDGLCALNSKIYLSTFVFQKPKATPSQHHSGCDSNSSLLEFRAFPLLEVCATTHVTPRGLLRAEAVTAARAGARLDVTRGVERIDDGTSASAGASSATSKVRPIANCRALFMRALEC